MNKFLEIRFTYKGEPRTYYWPIASIGDAREFWTILRDDDNYNDIFVLKPDGSVYELKKTFAVFAKFVDSKKEYTYGSTQKVRTNDTLAVYTPTGIDFVTVVRCQRTTPEKLKTLCGGKKPNFAIGLVQKFGKGGV